MIDNYCERYEPFYLNKHQVSLIFELRDQDKYIDLIDDYIDYHALNQREFEFCK